MPSIPDHLTEIGAIRLASRLADHWLKRGYRINTKVEPVTIEWNGKRNGTTHRVSTVYQVRTDMVGGLPKRGSRLTAIAA